MKHGHENHIIMVPLRILMRFFYRLSCIKEHSNVSEFIKKNCLTTLVLLGEGMAVGHFMKNTH